jgi:hypothetical protein
MIDCVFPGVRLESRENISFFKANHAMDLCVGLGAEEANS